MRGVPSSTSCVTLSVLKNILATVSPQKTTYRIIINGYLRVRNKSGIKYLYLLKIGSVFFVLLLNFQVLVLLYLLVDFPDLQLMI